MSTESVLNAEALKTLEGHDEAAESVEEPDNDLSVVAALHCKDPLVLELDNALQNHLLQASMKVSAALEMKHILLLLIKDFHDLSKSLQHHKQEWISRLQVTIEGHGQEVETTRGITGQIVVRHLEAAPWGLEKQPEASRSDTAHTILAVYAGMVRFLRKLSTELDKKAAEGIDLKQWGVEEMVSDNEDEDLKTDKASGGKSNGMAQASTKKTRARPNPGQQPPQWTTEETLALFKTFRDNAAATNNAIAAKHNAECWAGGNVRTAAAARQELKKHMGNGRREELHGRLQTKIDDLESK